MEDNFMAERSDRRAALKKAAVAAGVVAWTTPAVQAMTARPASAQGVTGCRPVLSLDLQQTGANCDCAPDVPPNCCNDLTYFGVPTASCGALCGGAGTLLSYSFPGATFKNGCQVEIYPELGQCNTGSLSISVQAVVLCADGIEYDVTQTVAATCTPCDL